MAEGLHEPHPAHPAEALVGALESAFAAFDGSPVWTLTSSQLADLVPRIGAVTNRLEALGLAVLREADRHQVGDAVGAANTGAWFANVTRTTKPAAAGAISLAARLDADEHTTVRSAFAAGAVARDQARVIIKAVDALPVELVEPAVRRQAEAHLVAFAEHHDARDLRFLGRRILEYVAPEVAEAHERKILEREEALANANASFSMSPDGAGSLVGRFKIPVLAGKMLAKHLNALAAPGHQAATTGTVDLTTARPLRLGQAFVEYIETRSAEDTPRAGGLAATIAVTMTMASLLGVEQAATLDTGDRISASEARRLACEAGIIPAVLGGRSQPLDVGRQSRFHTGPQRVAIALRDKGCVVKDCDKTPDQCHVHHLTAWSRGGRTTVDDAIMICGPHHRVAHDARFQMKTDKHGKVIFSRRT
ncbi:hypothetical protein ABIE44_000512 [Marmoricola sp. OAE513]|uniref:HNH endonuclease signature motif containing protein n=1 Tax=Marmoricola sp. OAE513 TaxID=2817894 RepID=UPI001AE5B2EC